MKNVWAQLEDGGFTFLEFVDKHGLEHEEGNLFGYLVRVMNFATKLGQASHSRARDMAERVRALLGGSIFGWESLDEAARGRARACSKSSAPVAGDAPPARVPRSPRRRRWTPRSHRGRKKERRSCSPAVRELPIMTDHTVRCWGANTFGQLGDRSQQDAPAPVTPAVPGVVDLRRSATLRRARCSTTARSRAGARFGFGKRGPILEPTVCPGQARDARVRARRGRVRRVGEAAVPSGAPRGASCWGTSTARPRAGCGRSGNDQRFPRRWSASIA